MPGDKVIITTYIDNPTKPSVGFKVFQTSYEQDQQMK